MSADAPSALDGLTVVDLSTGRAAALATSREKAFRMGFESVRVLRETDLATAAREGVCAIIDVEPAL